MRRFEVDHQLELRRRLHRQVGGLLAIEDAVDIAGGAPVLVDQIRPIGEANRGQLVLGRKLDDVAPRPRRCQDQAAAPGSR